MDEEEHTDGHNSESDELLDAVTNEADKLKKKLVVRLQEVNDLESINMNTLENAIALQTHTSNLESKSRSMKWKWFWEYYKWIIGITVVVGVILYFLLKKK